MKSGCFVLSLGFVLLTDLSLLAQGRRGEDGARYGWLPTLAAGKAEAKKTGKPIMVVLRCVP